MQSQSFFRSAIDFSAEKGVQVMPDASEIEEAPTRLHIHQDIDVTLVIWLASCHSAEDTDISRAMSGRCFQDFSSFPFHQLINGHAYADFPPPRPCFRPAANSAILLLGSIDQRSPRPVPDLKETLEGLLMVAHCKPNGFGLYPTAAWSLPQETSGRRPERPRIRAPRSSS